MVGFMASKKKKKINHHRISKSIAQNYREQAEALIEKERYKEAVKQAKLCYREEGTPEHHRLLERAYFLRAKQLREGGMTTAAREVAHHLIEFGITDLELTEPSAELLMALGMSDPALELQGRLETSGEGRESLIRQAADQAVLDPNRAPSAMPEVREGAARVRTALEALEAGDEARAMAELRDVSRGSPFSDWKLFARGLAAFHRRETDEAMANWSRLDADRAPSRIARSLQMMAGLTSGDESALSAAERRAFGDSILGPLRQLNALVVQDRWAEAVRMLGPLRSSLRRIDPAMAERLTRVLYDPMIRSVSKRSYDEARRLIRDFSKTAEPLAIDPYWNRFWALIWEGPQGSIDEAEPYWRSYVKDLRKAPALKPEERPTAQAIVLRHLGRELVEEASAIGAGMFGMVPAARKEIDRERRRAVQCLEESLQLDPSQRETYEALIDAYQRWDQPDQAAEAARRLLQAAPDDLDALLHLSQYHFRRDEPSQALEYAQRARTLKPLDTRTADLEWAARVSLARQLAIQGRFDEGRAELDAADRLLPESSRELHFKARKAVFEFKAGQSDRAEQIIAEEQDRLPEPTPLWLALLIEARRYQLPKPLLDRFEARWTNALSKRRKAETAGALADLLGAFLASDISYPGRVEHVRQVADYLRPATRLKYSREDLVRICQFLIQLPEERDTAEKMARRGTKLFPDVPEFFTILGSLEMSKGSYGGNLWQARRHFETALSLAQAQASSDPRAAALLPKIKQSLSMIEALTSGPMGLPFASLPFGGPGPGPSMPDPSSLPLELIDMIEAMADDMGVDPEDLYGLEDEDEDFFDEEGAFYPPPPLPSPPPPPSSRPRPPSPARKKGKKKKR